METLKITDPSILHRKLTLINEDTVIEGRIELSSICRIHGVLRGQVIAAKGSTLILAQTGVIEGTIEADTLIIQGYVKADIKATTKITLTSTARVIGQIETQSFQLAFGAYFEGHCTTENKNQITPKPRPTRSPIALHPAETFSK
jgi:cytoskeletal protein CcmA (bactofilin family)